jgi:hypothetical protein
MHISKSFKLLFLRNTCKTCQITLISVRATLLKSIKSLFTFALQGLNIVCLCTSHVIDR